MITFTTTKALVEQLASPELVLVDVRASAAYNGWKLRHEARGGHIQGALSFPLSWTQLLSGEDLTARLWSKGITPSRTVVVYGYGRGESAVMAEILRDRGFAKVSIYDAGLQEWASNDSLPMARLANHEKLVHPLWLRQLIAAEKPEAYPARGFVLLEVVSEQMTGYGMGHIPGAVSLHTNTIEEEPLWNRVSDDRLEDVLLAHGITSDKTAVLYSRDTMAATRAASILMYAGVRDVRLLDGGFAAWTSAGYDLERERIRPVPAAVFGRTIPGHPEYMADTEDVKELLASNGAVLASVRSWAEYVGDISGYDYIEPRGRIAGAVWGHSGSDPHHLEHYRNFDGTMRSYRDISSRWRDAGITPAKRVIFYCGTGWRAGEAFFYAHLLGWTNVSVYDGGWLEWSLDKSNPVEQGRTRDDGFVPPSGR